MPVSLQDIIGQCKGLEIFEQRADEANYYEAVFFNKDVDALNRICLSYLGPAAKPPGAKVSKEDLALTKKYGGIADNQTLFKKDHPGGCMIVMFWPWGNELYTTVKLICLQK